MMPKEKITLDTDWFYRVPLKIGVQYLSETVDNIRVTIGKSLGNNIAKANELLKDPKDFTDKLLSVKDIDGVEEDDVLKKPIGFMLTVTALFFVFIVIYAFLKI